MQIVVRFFNKSKETLDRKLKDKLIKELIPAVVKDVRKTTKWLTYEIRTFNLDDLMRLNLV